MGELQVTDLEWCAAPQQAGVAQGRHERVGELSSALGLGGQFS
jgi:hypothetical protein